MTKDIEVMGEAAPIDPHPATSAYDRWIEGQLGSGSTTRGRRRARLPSVAGRPLVIYGVDEGLMPFGASEGEVDCIEIDYDEIKRGEHSRDYIREKIRQFEEFPDSPLAQGFLEEMRETLAEKEAQDR